MNSLLQEIQTKIVSFFTSFCTFSTPNISFTTIEMLNAKYAINVARKLGCCVFLLPEDIVEVKSKLLLTFVGALMSVDK
jgi:hypothetical protein